jgi:hypothetical protein
MHFPLLRVPARILEHPVEAVVAAALLVALLFVSSYDPDSANTAPKTLVQKISSRM